MKKKFQKEYENNLKKWKIAYEEILSVCEKYKEFNEYGFYDIGNMINKAKNHLLLIEWYEKYGIDLDHTSHDPYSRSFIDINSYLSFQKFEDAELCKKEHRGRSISWSDDDRQPEDGWYLVIGFSTGAYIFGKDYDGQEQLFQDFFKELKTYKPDYSDTVNKKLFWKIENVKKIFDDFNGILNKYHEKNRAELNARKVKKLKAELEKLEKPLNNI
jgi:hypothetical protein